MDSKREENSLISDLMTFVALIVLFVLLKYGLKILRLRRDELVIETDEIVLPIKMSPAISDDISEISSAVHRTSEESETPVAALAQEPSSSMEERSEQDSSEVLETQIDVSDTEPSVLEEASAEAEGEHLAGEAYCMKCKKKRDMQNPQKIVTKNGRNALEGVCPVCGTRLFRFVSQ